MMFDMTGPEDEVFWRAVSKDLMLEMTGEEEEAAHEWGIRT